MRYLLDTGVLLRLRLPNDPQYANVRDAVRKLRAERHELVITAQNAAGFWNVSTRPTAARGGYGLSVGETDRRLKLIERLFQLLPDTPNAYPLWRELVVKRSVCGVQVHDARLTALMEAHAVTHLLTLNPDDFKRYAQITAVTPLAVLSSP